MESLKLTYYNIGQIAPYFKSLENIPNLVFGQRRALTKLNEELEKEVNALNKEIMELIEKCRYLVGR